VSNHAHRRRQYAPEEAPAAPQGWWRRLWRRLTPAATGPVCVASVSSRVEAEMMTGMLRSHGIAAHVLADDAGGTDPLYQSAFGVRVVVPSGQAHEASALIAQTTS
jgi:hypothetical protein